MYLRLPTHFQHQDVAGEKYLIRKFGDQLNFCDPPPRASSSFLKKDRDITLITSLRRT